MKNRLILLLLLFISTLGYSQVTPVNVGTSANDRTGDPLRTAMQKLNANDVYLDGRIDDADALIDTVDTRLDSLIAAGVGGVSDWGDIGGTLSDQTDLNTALGLKAPLASPTFTGVPSAPTAATRTNTSQIANTAFVQDAVGYLPEVGQIIDENWTNLSSWTQVGTATWGVSSNQLTITGGTPASPTLSNYIRHSGYGNSVYQLYEQEADIVVGTINATSWGIAFGAEGMGGLTPYSVHAALMLDNTNLGKLRVYTQNSNATSTTSNAALGITAGDVVTFKVIFGYNSVELNAFNNNTNRGIKLTVYQNENTSQFITPNVYQHAIFGMGGTHKVNNYTVTVRDKKRADWLIIGDSFIAANSNQKGDFGCVRLLQSKVFDRISTYAGSGNRIQDAMASEILALTPRNIIIQLGTNNVSAGDNAATVVSRINTLLSSLTGYTLGTNVFVMEIAPRSDTDVSGYATAYASEWDSGIIPVFQTMVASGSTAMNSEYVSSDGLHPSTYGHEILSNILFDHLPFEKKVLPKFLNGGSITIPPIRFIAPGSSTGLSNKFKGLLEYYNNHLYFTDGDLVTRSIDVISPSGNFAWNESTNQLVLVNSLGSASALRCDITTSSTNVPFNPVSIRATSTSNMVDGFGVKMNFQIQDNAAVANNIAEVGATRDGADNSGKLTFATYSAGTATTHMTISAAGSLGLSRTVTASGTTGAQTINKMSGTVNFAAGASTLVVTNSLVTTSSIVIPVVRTNDATALIKNVVPASGSFTITLNAAATAETSVGFFVIN